MYVDMNFLTLQSDIENEMKFVNKRLCEEIDVNIDNDNNVTQVYQKKCDGMKLTEDVISRLPQVLTIIASKSIRNETLFTKVPNELKILKFKYNMVEVITNNFVHFRAIANINHNNKKMIMNI